MRNLVWIIFDLRFMFRNDDSVSRRSFRYSVCLIPQVLQYLEFEGYALLLVSSSWQILQIIFVFLLLKNVKINNIFVYIIEYKYIVSYGEKNAKLLFAVMLSYIIYNY